ncbi:MAG: tetratricopeptide repeat protein, partial [Acidobacteriota bacterium]|nr:tetratricopeptide repeat protein [Acidobacteriota bacterium]
AQGAAVDQRADMYSFGLVVYDMLLGRQRLARRDNPMTELMSRMQHAPPAVRTLDETVPEALESVVTRCLQPLPEDRYATTAELVTALDQLTEDGHQMELPKPPSRVLTMALAAILVVVLAAGGTWFWKYGAGYAPPTDPVSVLIANFDNRAKDPVFDGLVEQALGVGIEGASFVTAYPRPQALRLVNTLKFGPTLDEENARKIAQREGIKRVVSGSIDSAGGQRYKLSVKILDPTDGKALLTWDTTANGKSDVLNAVGRLAAKVRNGLGDRSASTRTLKDGETFTAATLEAAHEYVNAQELQAEGKYDLALAGYQKAVDADPKLGRAYAGLGAVSASLGKPDNAQTFYEQALGLLDRMTDREKYRTQAGYYLLMKDSDKAKDQLDALVKQFPADSTALTNLAYVYFLRRDMPKAMELGGKASAIYPNNVLRRNNMALYAMYAGQFEVAEKEAANVIKLNKEFAKAYLVMAISQLGLGRPADAEATWQLLHAVSAAGSDFAVHGRADMAVYEGRLSDASRILEEAIKSPPEGRSAITTARFIMSLAEVRQMQGHDADAVKLAEEALAKSTDQTIALFAGRVLVFAGRPARALALAADLGKGLDREAQMVGKVLEGEVDLKRDDIRSAVQHFKEANALGDSWMTRNGLGRAYLAAGAYPDAQTEFDVCLKRNGEATAVMLDDIPTYRLAATSRYYMGRAQEGLKSASAIDSYKTFLAIKQKGDEQGLVADARRRVAALPSR